MRFYFSIPSGATLDNTEYLKFDFGDAAFDLTSGTNPKCIVREH